MEDKKLKRRCERIMAHVYPKLDDSGLNGHNQDAVYNMIRDIQCVAFAFGYVVGQSVQLTYSEAQKDVEAIKKVIREQGLLRYLSKALTLSPKIFFPPHYLCLKIDSTIL